MVKNVKYQNMTVSFEIEDGELEITKAEIVVRKIGNSGSKVYDDEELDISGYELEYDSDLFNEEFL